MDREGTSQEKKDVWIVEFPEGSEPEDEMAGERVRKLLTAPDEEARTTSKMTGETEREKTANAKELRRQGQPVASRRAKKMAARGTHTPRPVTPERNVAAAKAGGTNKCEPETRAQQRRAVSKTKPHRGRATAGGRKRSRSSPAAVRGGNSRVTQLQ